MKVLGDARAVCVCVCVCVCAYINMGKVCAAAAAQGEGYQDAVRFFLLPGTPKEPAQITPGAVPVSLAADEKKSRDRP
jgi:hypothetical protein